MCTKNYILLNRNLLINDLWNSEPFTRGQAWVDLLLNTNWKDGTAIIKGVSIPVKRGQACRSVKQLAIRWKWSEGKAKRYLDLLVSLGQISYETCGKNGAVNGAVKTGITTLITILNYNTYQLDGAHNGAQTERKQSGDGAQTETYKKGNKGEKGEEGKEEKLQQRLTPEEVKENYLRYAGLLMVNSGQMPIFIDIAHKYPADIILESFQAGNAGGKRGPGYLNWCLARMKGKSEEAPTENETDAMLNRLCEGLDK